MTAPSTVSGDLALSLLLVSRQLIVHRFVNRARGKKKKGCAPYAWSMATVGPRRITTIVMVEWSDDCADRDGGMDRMVQVFFFFFAFRQIIGGGRRGNLLRKSTIKLKREIDPEISSAHPHHPTTMSLRNRSWIQYICSHVIFIGLTKSDATHFCHVRRLCVCCRVNPAAEHIL